MLRYALLALLLVLLVLLAALVLWGVTHDGAAPVVRGGAAPTNLVVDTLNLVHYLDRPVTTQGIIGAIDATAGQLRERYGGRVVYVVKDRDTSPIADRTQSRLQAASDGRPIYPLYREASQRNRVVVVLVEKTEPLAKDRHHSAYGRDDFEMVRLADKYRAAVLSNDRLRDLPDLIRHVPPYWVREYLYWRDLPVRDHVRPQAYKHLHRPRLIRLDEALGPRARPPEEGKPKEKAY